MRKCPVLWKDKAIFGYYTELSKRLGKWEICDSTWLNALIIQTPTFSLFSGELEVAKLWYILY